MNCFCLIEEDFYLNWGRESARSVTVPKVPPWRRWHMKEVIPKYEEESGAGWRQLLPSTPKLPPGLLIAHVQLNPSLLGSPSPWLGPFTHLECFVPAGNNVAPPLAFGGSISWPVKISIPCV